jgi:hypothetical protein
MTNDDLERALRAFARRQPFRHFFIEFHSGEHILITHPEAVDRFGGLFLYRAANRGQRVFSGDGVSQLIDPPPT